MRGDKAIFAAVHASKDPTSFMVLFEDSAALVGIVIATVATALSISLGKPWIDGAGSMGIGIVLALVAVLLASESKALLIGERARPELGESIREIALHQPGVLSVSGILTSQLSPDQVIANVGVEFADDLRTADIEKLIGHLETELRKKHPDLFRVFVRPHPDRYQGEVGLLDVGPESSEAGG
jgi:divalent metal cation (Fe/Co/Zn/Cd) transporter